MVLDLNERDLIFACQRGDPDAFAALFEANKDRVYSIALRYSGDPALALDIAQDVFLKVLSRIHEFRGGAGLDTWLYRLVVNSCIDHQRRERRLMPLLEDLLDLFRTSDDTVLQDLMRAEMAKDVQQVVAKLPPEQRIVVVMRYTDGLSYDEIAEILSCSAGTVASRLSRAHKALQRRLSHLRKEERSHA